MTISPEPLPKAADVRATASECIKRNRIHYANNRLRSNATTDKIGKNRGEEIVKKP